MSTAVAAPVTVVATRSARPGREQEFAASLERLRELLTCQPGYQGTAIMAPVAPSREALVVYRFSDPESLRAWHDSSARKSMIVASADVTEAAPHERSVSAVDGWFASTDGRVVRPPARWKTWLISSAAIWVLLTLITVTAGPLLGPLPAPARFAVVVPVLSAAMTWLVMPRVTRMLSGWLQAP